MKCKLLLAAAFAAMLSLTACGGGGSSSNASSSYGNPASLTITDTVLGTGATAVVGKTATVTYTGYLYNPSASDYKGTKFDSNVGGTPFSFVLGTNPLQVIAGFDQGVTGMKVGGKRTVIIPASLGYGATGNGSIPANAGLVFDIELTNVQ